MIKTKNHFSWVHPVHLLFWMPALRYWTPLHCLNCFNALAVDTIYALVTTLTAYLDWTGSRLDGRSVFRPRSLLVWIPIITTKQHHLSFLFLLQYDIIIRNLKIT
jgi:hypothetical protein